MLPFYVWRTVLVATIGAVLAGLHIGSINGMFEMHGFQATFPELFQLQDNCTLDPVTGTLFSEFENVTAACGICTATKTCGGSGADASSILGLMVSIANFGAAIGALFGGWPCTTLGRRLTLSMAGWIMALGSLLSAVSYHSWLFIIGRGISGFSMGLSYGIMAMYISEVSPRDSRGRLASMIGPLYGLALAFQFAANCGFSRFCLGWRVSLLMQVIAGIVYGIVMLCLPKTPRWLVLHDRSHEAHYVLSRINNSPDVTLFELQDLKMTTNKISTSYFKDMKNQLSMTIKWKYLKRLILCTVLFIFTPVIGNFTYYFGNTFFCKLNIDPCTSNSIVGVSLLFGGAVTSLFMDKAGRKAILLIGTLLMIIIQALITAIILVFNVEEEDNDAAGYALTVLFCAFAIIYAGAWVTTPWVISSEIFPVETRGLKVAISTTVFWISATVSTQVIPIIIDSVLGIAGYMSILVGLTVLAFFLVLLGIPETKGVSLEEMDLLFELPWLKRINLVYYLSCGLSSVYYKQSSTECVDFSINTDCEKTTDSVEKSTEAVELPEFKEKQ